MADIQDLTKQKQAILGTMLPRNREIIGSMMADLDEALLPDEERRELIRSVFNDSERANMLAEARIRRIFNNIEANTMGASFFEMEVLGEGDHPMYVVATADVAYVDYIGQNGKPPKRQRVIPETPYLVPLQWIASEEIEYTKQSIYLGDLRSFDDVNQRIEIELGNQTDVNIKALLDSGAEASFSDGVLAPHRLIDTDNLPAGNLLDLSAQGSLTLPVFKAILTQMDKAGLVATSIHIPSAHKGQMRDFVSLVAAVASTGDVEKPSLTVPEAIHTELFRSGKLNDFYGHNIDIVGHNTLALKTGYVATNAPAGYWPVKPSLSETILDDGVAMRKRNMESLMARKVEAYYMPLPNRVNYIKFTYDT
jgi:hypothetical protein